MTFDDTTTHPWIAQSGPIHLRRAEPKARKPLPRDLDAATGIVVGVLAGANFLVWAYVLARWAWG